MLLLIKVCTPSSQYPIDIDIHYSPGVPALQSLGSSQLHHPSPMITHVQTKSIPLAKTLGTRLASRKCAIIIKDNKRKGFSEIHKR